MNSNQIYWWKGLQSTKSDEFILANELFSGSFKNTKQVIKQSITKQKTENCVGLNKEMWSKYFFIIS
jgi:hypothetical protein